MSASGKGARRLVYGPATYAGHDGIIIDAESAERFGRAARSTTLGDYVADFLGESWEHYVESEGGDHSASPQDPFDYSEWINDVMTFPADAAWDVAAKRVAEIVEFRKADLADIRSGGGSPGGNMDAISGPLDQLALLATLIERQRDGFTLERNDALVDFGMSRNLYE